MDCVAIYIGGLSLGLGTSWLLYTIALSGLMIRKSIEEG